MLRKLVYGLSRMISRFYPFVLSVLAALALAYDKFSPAALQQRPTLTVVALSALVIALFARLIFGSPCATRAATRSESLGFQATNSNSWSESLGQLDFGVLVLSCVFVVLQMTRGPESVFWPIVYLSIALLVGFQPRWVGAVLTVFATILVWCLHQGAHHAGDGWQPLIWDVAFVVLFAVANLLFVQVDMARRRRQGEKRLANEIRAMKQEAEEFRLIGSAVSVDEGRDRSVDEARLARAAVESIHQGMFFLLDTLKRALQLQTCVLLWLDNSGRQLRIKELVTDTTMIRETPVPAMAGALGGIVTNRLLVNLEKPRDGSSIAYYDGPARVGAFLGVPVLEDGQLRGVLCGDRVEAKPFTAPDEELFSAASQQVLRAIQTERIFGAVERSKYEHERFFRASRMLNSALTLAQVYETAFAAAREIVAFDQGALTLYDSVRRTHTICKIIGSESTELEGQSFPSNAGLVAMVVKNKHFLPAGEPARGNRQRDRETMIFTPELRFRRPSESLVVLPLLVQDRAIGTFVLASSHAHHFSSQCKQMLGVISNQVAVSIENAKMFKRMEELATTDGLTGLPNHRAFQGRLAEMLHRAERHQSSIAIVICDVDRFKSVNDTYGHPAGDAVLRRVAAVLGEQARKVDIVARYGGEEFALVLDETDGNSAQWVCERIRLEVERQTVTTDRGTLSVTLSLGIASCPEDGMDKEELIGKADQALYAAKERGRNQTVRYGAMHQARPAERTALGAAAPRGKQHGFA